MDTVRVSSVFFIPASDFMTLIDGCGISFHPSVGRSEVELVVHEDIPSEDLYDLIVSECGRYIPAGYVPVPPDEGGYVVLDSGCVAIRVQAV